MRTAKHNEGASFPEFGRRWPTFGVLRLDAAFTRPGWTGRDVPSGPNARVRLPMNRSVPARQAVPEKADFGELSRAASSRSTPNKTNPFPISGQTPCSHGRESYQSRGSSRGGAFAFGVQASACGSSTQKAGSSLYSKPFPCDVWEFLVLTVPMLRC